MHCGDNVPLSLLAKKLNAGLLLAARDVERIASGCAAGSSTAPPCASLPVPDLFRPSRREHQDWSLLPSSVQL